MLLKDPATIYELAKQRGRLGEAIRTIRVSRKLTQSKLAVHLGWARTKLVSIERGHQATTVDQLFELGTVLGVAVTVFFPLELHLFDPWHPDTERKGNLGEAEAKRRRRR